MDSIDCVEQKGIIEEITNGIATVNITSFSACSSCQSKAGCDMSESEEKQIHVAVDSNLFKKGELVKILMKRSLGLRATLIAYVLPFCFVLIALNNINLLRSWRSYCRTDFIGGARTIFFITTFKKR